MNCELKKYGFTLVELLVVLAIAVMLMAVMIASSRAVETSYNSSGAQTMISSAVASARAIAAKERCYAGIRFQQAYSSDSDNAHQYMIFIVYDMNATGLASGFRAVSGLKPVRLPDNLGVMDLRVRTSTTDASDSNDVPVDIANGGNSQINSDDQITDITSFSIIFSPAGKLIIHDVRVRNRDGKFNLDNSSTDEVFNTKGNVMADANGMFIQDDYANMGLGQESSRSSFVIYDKTKIKAVNRNQRWTAYLNKLSPIYINPYTGTIIER